MESLCKHLMFVGPF